MIKNPVLAIMLIVIILAGCKGNRNLPEAEEAINVITAPVSVIQSRNEISLSGNIEGSKTVRLGFMVAGRIDHIAADEGKKIFGGELIASLDPSSYAIASELADIQVSQAEDEYNRLKSMFENRSLSESDFSKVTHLLQQAKAQQKHHAKNLAETKLYSPIDGILLKKLAEVGEITGVGLPLFVISDIRNVKVTAFIPGNELHKVSIGQSAQVQVPSLKEVFEGSITEVGSAADVATRSFPLKIEIDNPKLLIRPGMIAEIRIMSVTTDRTMAVPVESIRHDHNDQCFVFVVDTASNKAFRRDVQCGRLINDMIGIVSGLREKEIIVTGGHHKLVDGSLIATSK